MYTAYHSPLSVVLVVLATRGRRWAFLDAVRGFSTDEDSGSLDLGMHVCENNLVSRVACCELDLLVISLDVYMIVTYLRDASHE